MKLLISLLIALSGLGAACHTQGNPSPVTSAASADSARGFAVVELFTSEGCSSCPPADQVLAKVQHDLGDKAVYILAFHVSYWDKLGWKDAFSDPAWTQRQGSYATWLHLPSVYTPEVVVNGRTEFVGSEETRLRQTITGDLQQASNTTLALDHVQKTPTQVSIDYQTNGTGNLLFALIQKNATTNVQRGENAGATLSHVQIVRSLLTLSLASAGNKGTARLTLPEGLDGQQLEVIAFVQNKETGLISAGAKSSL